MRFSITFVTVCWVTSVALRCDGVQLRSGDIVAPQADNFGTVLVIHPETGDREVLSLSPDIGNGPALYRPHTVLRLPGGDFLVGDSNLGDYIIARIDHLTGDRTIVAGAGVGDGPLDDIINGVLLTPSGETILINQGGSNSPSGYITKLNLQTGDRQLISGLGMGTGPEFQSLDGGAIDANGDLVVCDGGLSAIFKVNLSTGQRTILSGLAHGDGPEILFLRDLAVMPNGAIITTNYGVDESLHFFSSVLRIDPETGDRTTIVSAPDSSLRFTRITVESPTSILASHDTFREEPAIYSIDITNGAKTLISGNGRGDGPELFWGDMAIVPEPTSMVLVLMGVGGLTFRRWACVSA